MDMKLTMIRIKAAIRYFLSRRKAVAVTRDGRTYYGVDGDDKCEACGRNVAMRECAHGILCTRCDKEMHGSVGGECKIR